ncbi:peroxidase-like [Battus philenor]|uniref:peroxidase-like n=1 Tax=Battus philenor TaxID=42288 RepID=UPI0035D0E632
MANVRILILHAICIFVFNENKSFSSGELTSRLQHNGCSLDKNDTPENEIDLGSGYITPICDLMEIKCQESRYRSYDGTCNNLQNPYWGATKQPFAELEIDRSEDSTLNSSLPNPRTISLKVFYDKNLIDKKWTLLTMQWGQVVAHDMALSLPIPADGVVCCDANGKFTEDSFTNPICAPIPIPDIDVVNKADGTECIDFVRATTSRNINCTGPSEPNYAINDINSYMDLSLTYGNDNKQAQALREGKGGRLLTTERNGGIWPPQAPDIAVSCPDAMSEKEPCYNTGDIRGNQNTQLSALQVILLKEHNRVADILSKYNKHWDDETIFQETRRILIAQIQQINYYHFFPILLGEERMRRHKLIYKNCTSYINDYDPKISAAVLKVFTTGSYRFFHTLIRGLLQVINENRKLENEIRISDWFNRPVILEEKDNFDGLVRGLSFQPEDRSDQYFNIEITQYLFKGNRTNGQDLRAIDIQRGRDHRVPKYVAVRRYCGLSVPKKFKDLSGDISHKNIEALKCLYKKVEDIDFAVGGSLEKHKPGALAGPTNLCILIKQLYITRVGDRLFFENGFDEKIRFTPSQLETIRKNSSLARLLCDNGINIKKMQPNAFLQVFSKNKVVPCSELPAIDLSLWKEEKDEKKDEI